MKNFERKASTKKPIETALTVVLAADEFEVPDDEAFAGRFSLMKSFASSVVLNFLKIAPVNPLTCVSHSDLKTKSKNISSIEIDNQHFCYLEMK